MKFRNLFLVSLHFPMFQVELCGIPIKDFVSYLGIKICKDQDERVGLNFNTLIEKIKKRFDGWLLKDSINGRVF